MSTKGVADIVFCLDASRSMEPCIEEVKRYISNFVGVFSNVLNKQDESLMPVGALIKKIHTLKVKLVMVTPDSEGFEMLSAQDKCGWDVVAGGDGLARVNFEKLLTAIAKSISKSQTPLGAPPPVVQRALFGQGG